MSLFTNDVMDLSDNAILNTKFSGYRCIISLISKNEAVNLIHFIEKTGTLQNTKVIITYKNGYRF